MSYGKCASSAQMMRRERCILWTRRTALSPLSASSRRSQGCRKSMVKNCRQGILLLSLVLVLAGCRGAPPPAPTPLPTPTTAAASPAPTPSPQPWPEGVLFYELEEPEQTCLGYQEYLLVSRDHHANQDRLHPARCRDRLFHRHREASRNHCAYTHTPDRQTTRVGLP